MVTVTMHHTWSMVVDQTMEEEGHFDLPTEYGFNGVADLSEESLAQCGESTQWLDVHRGEKAMLAFHQMSDPIFPPTLLPRGHDLEMMQDIGVEMDTTWPLLDEQRNPTISSAQTGCDYMHDHEIPSPSEYTYEDHLGTNEEPNMYCNNMYDQYDSVNLYPPFTNMSDDDKNMLKLYRYSKVKSAATRDLQIFHSAVPVISGDSGFSYNLNKMCSDLRADELISENSNKVSVSEDMDKDNFSTDIDDTDKGIADEIIVTTEESCVENYIIPEVELPEEEPEGWLGCGEKEAIPFQQDTECFTQFFKNNPEALQNLDTPEIEKTFVDGRFNLLDYMESNGDLNNNANSTPVEYCQEKSETPRRGKSLSSMRCLKLAQEVEQGEPLQEPEDAGKDFEPSTSSSGTSPSGRPVRQSASNFKKRLEKGLLSSDDEDDPPKAKRQRRTSTASLGRRRLNSDSDRSSTSEDPKYRERRNRNNLSSKRSRQKKKEQNELKQRELRELETENDRLRQEAAELESLLTRVKDAWKDYLAHMNEDEDRR